MYSTMLLSLYFTLSQTRTRRVVFTFARIEDCAGTEPTNDC